MVCVCGIGYVGLITSLCLANSGVNTCCLDSDSRKIELLKTGNPCIYEPGTEELLKKAISNSSIHFTDNKEIALSQSDIIFICIGTPTVNGSTDLSSIQSLIDDIYKYSKSNKIIVIKSTVPIGTCNCLQDKLDAMPSKKIKFNIVSNPEFLREGSAIQDFWFPERIIIGSKDLESLKCIESLYRKIIPNNVPIILTDTCTSEMIKYVSNSFLSVKISFINEIAKLASCLGANIKDLEYAVGLDSRIGHAHLKSGPGFGGSCLPKDLEAFINYGMSYNIDMLLCRAAQNINRMQIDVVVDLLKEETDCIDNIKIALWGVTFKKDTNDVRCSPSLGFVEKLQQLGAIISIYDPIGISEFKTRYPETKKIQYEKSKDSTIKNADFLVVMTDWDEFRDVDFVKIKNTMKKPIIIDCKKIYWDKQESIKAGGFLYKYIGMKRKQND